jgi:membrane protein DedA with SNARE-associated domain
MDERKFSILGLVGFAISGALFMLAGLRAGDLLTAAASLVWLASCVVWMIPLLRRGRSS